MGAGLMMPSHSMRMLRKYLPNAITLTAMCCGLTALRLSYIREDIYYSLLLLLFAAFLDGIDGKVARRLNVESPVGGQLDSLADFLNFCITPALIMYEWHLKDVYFFGWTVTLIFLCGGAYRLARFNVMYSNKGMENISSNFFVGVPTPAGAIIVFLPMVLTLQGYLHDTTGLFTMGYMILVAFLMVSTIKTPSHRMAIFTRKRALILTLALGVFIGASFANPFNAYLVTTIGYLLVITILYFKNDIYRRRVFR
jgi:CDP-diacylglycerol---serine O-phosphatidyltransferase